MRRSHRAPGGRCRGGGLRLPCHVSCATYVGQLAAGSTSMNDEKTLIEVVKPFANRLIERVK
jgi:hypothetical protein